MRLFLFATLACFQISILGFGFFYRSRMLRTDAEAMKIQRKSDSRIAMLETTIKAQTIVMLEGVVESLPKLDGRGIEALVYSIHQRDDPKMSLVCQPAPCPSDTHGEFGLAQAHAPGSRRAVESRMQTFVKHTSAALRSVGVRRVVGGGCVNASKQMRVFSTAANSPKSSMISNGLRWYGLALAFTLSDQSLFEFSLRNFLAFTSESWGLIVGYTPRTKSYVMATLRSLNLLPQDFPQCLPPGRERCGVVLLEFNTEFDYADFNRLLKKEAFWGILPGEKLLYFQSDSLILRANGIDEFANAGWDYIGATWIGGKVGNGGFSLRSRQAMMNIAHVWPGSTNKLNEDIYFAHLAKLTRHNVADFMTAKNFSVEYDKTKPRSVDPAGVHQLTDVAVNTKPWGSFKRMVQIHVERLGAIRRSREVMGRQVGCSR